MDTQEVLKAQTDAGAMDIGQKVMIGVVALVVLVGGYFVFKPSASSLPATQTKTPEVGGLTAPSAVIAGAYTYQLGGLGWVFEPQSTDETGAPTTRVRMELKGFMRNSIPIEVALYRLGTYHGDCKAYEDMPEGYELPTPGALAFAQCWFAGGGRQLAVFQEGNNLVVKVRTVDEEESEPQPLSAILTIDLTKVVQSAL